MWRSLGAAVAVVVGSLAGCTESPGLVPGIIPGEVSPDCQCDKPATRLQRAREDVLPSPLTSYSYTGTGMPEDRRAIDPPNFTTSSSR